MKKTINVIQVPSVYYLGTEFGEHYTVYPEGHYE